MGNPTTLLTSNSYYGEVVTFGGAGAISQYELYYWSSSSLWTGSICDGSGAFDKLLSISIGTAPNQGMLLRGYVYNSTWNWTVGSPLYIGCSVGQLTQTQPSGSGEFVRVVGYAISADLIYFNPSQEWIELV